MNDQVTDSNIATIQRELAYYRREYNEIGAQLLRVQEEQSRASREARRSRIVSNLVREAYRLIGDDIEPHAIGKLILATIADTAMCDCAAFLRCDPSHPEVFVVEHRFGQVTPATIQMVSPPDFIVCSSRHPAGAQAGRLVALLEVPYVLWSYNAAHGRALVLGNKTETNIHRAFEAADRELVDVALAVYVDVLLRKAAEAELRRAKQVAEDANAVRAKFLATLSHEFRSPLEAVIGFSEILLKNNERTISAEQRVEYTHQILDSGQRLLTLVKDILDFSRFENVTPILRLNWIPVGQILKNAVRGMAAEAQNRRVNLEILQPEGHWYVAIDYERFRQILSNLIGNALKFTAPFGTIIVAARIVEDSAIEISVADNGVGIAPHDIERVLEPFIQAADVHGRRMPGAGLGLSIAKQLAEAHGGTLSIASIVGNGTTVTIKLSARSTRFGKPDALP